ncbi:MAG: ROK family protein [Arenibacter sp.]
MTRNYMGIDVGGTKIKTVVIQEDGLILEQNEVMTEDGCGKSEVWKKKIAAQISLKTQQYANGDVNLLKCGISAPGLVDPNNKKILHMPQRLKGIENFDWTLELDRDIKVLNDGHSACVAEYESFHRSQGIRHMLMLTLGTGVGGGIIINGELYQGHLQRAGHLGHMTVDMHGAPTMTKMPGSLEYAIGNFSVAERTDNRFQSTRKLVEAYQNGEEKARLWWLESVEKLAVALAALNNILSPEVIVLGGGITAGAKASLMHPLKEYMAQYEWRPGDHKVSLVNAGHGSYAGAIGAAFFAKNNIQRNKQ